MAKRRYISRRLAVAIRFLKLRVLGVDDSPHRIALGVAIGLFVAWMPTYGLHIVTVLLLTFLFRANKLAGLTSVLVTNPFTAAPAYYFSYLLGRKLLALFCQQPVSQVLQPQELSNPFGSTGNITTGIFGAEFWGGFWTWILTIGTELWIGCLVIGLTAASAGYLITLALVRLYRKKHPRRDVAPQL